LIEIHNNSTYNIIYNELSFYFIDAYCGFRFNGLDMHEALNASKICVQEAIADELGRNKKNARIVLKAYENLKNDTKLIEKAVNYFKRMN
jgi:hypothetical protein